MRNKKFSNKKILITGATGSVGTSIILELIKNYDFKVIRAMSNDENGLHELLENLPSSIHAIHLQ